MKSVLISIQPYWVFLIIARLIGWDISQEKTVEVRKDLPKDNAWNKVVHIYCSKNRKSFNRIPKKYQPLMAKFLGKVIGEFVCNKFENRYFYMDTDGTPISNIRKDFEQASCLKRKEIIDYILRPNKKRNVEKGTNWVYGWHISDLKIYDKPKELGEFSKWLGCGQLFGKCNKGCEFYNDCGDKIWEPITRPPQSWCYVENQ